jgi:hypothetical protein
MREHKIIQSEQFSLLIRITTILVLSLILTIVVVRYSSEHGKLAIPPDYDDSHSLVEGGLRYLLWKQDGLAAAWQHYVKEPPHSFLHYYLTAALFAIFGIHQSVPYWFSGVFLCCAAAGLGLLLWGIRLFRFVTLLGAFLCIPVMFNIVFDYRSECGMAALLLLACCLAIKSAWTNHHDRTLAIISGVFFALCLGMKPAMFIYVLGMLFCSCAVWIGAAFWRRDGSVTRTVQNAAIASLVGIVSFSFHYYLNANEIFVYIHSNAFTKNFWSQTGTFGDQLLFHLTGYAGKFELGIFTWPLIAITILGSLGSLVYKDKLTPELQKYLWSSIFLTMMAYAGVAINSIDQPYFGMTFDLLLGVSAALAIAILADVFPRHFGDSICVFILVLCLMSWRVPISQDYMARTKAVNGDAAVEWRRKGPEEVFQLVRSAWRKDARPKIWVGAFGWVDGNTITWEALKAGVPWKMWTYFSRLQNPSDEHPLPDWPDIFIIPQEGLMGTIQLPMTKLIPSMNAVAAKNPSLRLVGSVTDPKGKLVSVYIRKDSADERHQKD